MILRLQSSLQIAMYFASLQNYDAKKDRSIAKMLQRLMRNHEHKHEHEDKHMHMHWHVLSQRLSMIVSRGLAGRLSVRLCLLLLRCGLFLLLFASD